jgi:hypothetical protein
MRVFMCVTIDTECDKGAGWRTQRPMAFAGVLDGVVTRLQPLFRAHRAKPTYLLSPEVMRDAASAEALLRLDGSHELGTHLHGEYAEPGAHDPDMTRDFQREYPRDVERAKMEYTTVLFKRTFGRDPRSFRAGRFGIGSASLPILEELGYEVESSVTPHVDWSEVCRGLSFIGAPTQPYRPDPPPPPRPRPPQHRAVPVTIRPHALARAPLVGKLAPARWLRPTRGSAAQLVDVAKDEIRAAEKARTGRAVVLNAMFHNVEVIPAASPYANTEAAAQGILDRLAALLAFASKENIPVLGLGDVPELFA